MNDEKIKIDLDQYLIWPSIVALLFFLSCCWIYSNFVDFIFYSGILFAFGIGVFGLAKLFCKQFRKGVSYLIPTIFYFTILSPPLLDFRLQVIDIRHQVQFTLGRQQYESEASEIKKSGIKFKAWKWGTKGGAEYSLVYDESGEIAHTDSRYISHDPCYRRVQELEPHFYAVDDTCP